MTCPECEWEPEEEEEDASYVYFCHECGNCHACCRCEREDVGYWADEVLVDEEEWDPLFSRARG